MKKVIKIILILLAILALILLIAGIYVGLTVKKGLDLKNSIEEIDAEEIKNTIDEIKSGDCSKLEELELQAEELQAQVIDACNNPALKKVIEAEQPGACEIANDPNSDAQKELDELREYCKLV